MPISSYSTERSYARSLFEAPRDPIISLLSSYSTSGRSAHQLVLDKAEVREKLDLEGWEIREKLVPREPIICFISLYSTTYRSSHELELEKAEVSEKLVRSAPGADRLLEQIVPDK